MNIEQHVVDTLNRHNKAVTEGNNDLADRLDKDIEENSFDWMYEMARIISQQAEEIERLKSEIESTNKSWQEVANKVDEVYKKLVKENPHVNP